MYLFSKIWSNKRGLVALVNDDYNCFTQYLLRPTEPINNLQREYVIDALTRLR